MRFDPDTQKCEQTRTQKTRLAAKSSRALRKAPRIDVFFFNCLSHLLSLHLSIVLLLTPSGSIANSFLFSRDSDNDLGNAATRPAKKCDREQQNCLNNITCVCQDVSGSLLKTKTHPKYPKFIKIHCSCSAHHHFVSKSFYTCLQQFWLVFKSPCVLVSFTIFGYINHFS